MAERNLVVTAGGLKALTLHPLSKVEGQALWHLAGNLPVTGSIVSQTQLAATLSATPMHISRAIKRLCELGLLTRGPRVGHSYHYKLNPAFFRILM
jgi:DNA-binding MarR family transcriptional regulator